MCLHLMNTNQHYTTGLRCLTPHSLHVEVSGEFYQDASQCYGGQLEACAHQSCEEDRIGRSPEHITVDLLPAILITNITLLEQQKKGQ